MKNDIQMVGQISLFDYLDSLKETVKVAFDPLVEFVRYHLGSYVGSEERVLELYRNGASKKEIIDRLKYEYGEGGFGSFRFQPDDCYLVCGANYSRKGITVEYYEPGKIRGDYAEKAYNYSQVSDAIKKLYEEGAYNEKDN